MKKEKKYKCHVILPASGPKPLYYKTFIEFCKGILKSAGIPFTLNGESKSCYFVSQIGNEKVVFNFSDFYEFPDVTKYNHYFKFHYSKKEHSNYPNVYPFSPVSFYDWDQYYNLKNEIKYSCNNNTVLNLQRPYGDAVKNRIKVRDIIKENYPNDCLLNPNFKQEHYWKLINNCLVHVFVSGAREGILDRGLLQYLAFGCCTISPEITDSLPYNKMFLPGKHFIQCDSNYSDLIEKIEWCKTHRDECITIGNNAKKLFEEICTPIKLWSWIIERIKK
jgi:hypothetical protein